MYKRLLITSLFCCAALLSIAQSRLLEKKISFSYQRVSLEYALEDISKSYQLNFSYSRDYLPLQQRISAKADNVRLAEGLNTLFGQTKVVYAVIGDQVVLRVDKNKQIIRPIEPIGGKIGQLESPQPEVEEMIADVGTVETPPPPPSRPDWVGSEQIEPAASAEIDDPTEEEPTEIDQELEELPEWLRDKNLKKRRERVAQISILPFVGTNLERSDGITNNLSVNVLWGHNGGVDGVEVGGLVNSLKKDMIGLQVAGLGNSVEGMVHGTQIGGLFNYSGAYTTGLQAAGLLNVARSGQMVQIGGLFNAVEGDMGGVQIAGLFNGVGGDGETVQVAGLFNANLGNTKLQISGLFNVAGDVEHAQVSSIINIGKRVNGFQIGLINVSDTISGAPIGLLNIVKKGYNRWEWSAGDVLHANLALKLGARSFYNIFYLGVRMDNSLSNVPERDDRYSWGFGYGLGSSVALGRKTWINFELLSIQVNERERLTRKLNLLNQIKVTPEFVLGRKFSLFFGPSINIMVSRLYDPDTQSYGSTIPNYDLFNETNGTTNTRIWVGGNLGIRF
ncbi:MAG: hypothetical protein AAGG75_08830 [Bacteroidota bacterium]